MNEMVKKHIEECSDCEIFTDKKCSEPLKHHKVPKRCWETVAVDLFGPLPSKNHVVVIQDLSSRFPVAKLVKSTSALNVLPTLAETYDLLGNPEYQLSDNDHHSIHKLCKILPMRDQSNCRKYRHYTHLLTQWKRS